MSQSKLLQQTEVMLRKVFIYSHFNGEFVVRNVKVDDLNSPFPQLVKPSFLLKL